MRHLVFLSALLAAATLPAAQPATVDGELALGLLGLDTADGLRVGTVPDDLREFLPDGATVVGSLDRADDMSAGQGRYVTVVARVDAVLQEAIDAYAPRAFPGFLSRSGGRPPEENGFVTTPDPVTSFAYRAGDGDEVVSVSFSERPWGGSFVTIRRRMLYPFERQSRSEQEMNRQVVRMQQVLPPLTAPPGARLSNTGGGGGTDNHTDQAVIYGETSPADLAAHFGRQLAAAGWSAGGETTTRETATSLWTRTEGDRPLAAMFVTHQVGPGRAELRIHVLTVGE